MDLLEISFVENLPVIATVQTTVGECHDLGTASSRVLQFSPVARAVADETGGMSGRRANRLYERMMKAVERGEYDSEILAGAKESLKNQSYLEEAAKHTLSTFVPQYVPPTPLFFKPELVPNFGIRYTTNIDFVQVNQLYMEGQQPNSVSPINTAFLLSKITSTEADIVMASKDESEFAVDPIKSAIVSSKVANVLHRAGIGQEKLDIFQEVIVTGSRSIREAINNGDRTFREVIDLVNQASKFKEWLKNQGSDSDLRSEYCKSVANIDWAEKLPTKSLRFLVITGLSTLAGATMTPAAGLAAGAALSAADSFLLDRLLKGWKPNQFVEGSLKEFLKK